MQPRGLKYRLTISPVLSRAFAARPIGRWECSRIGMRGMARGCGFVFSRLLVLSIVATTVCRFFECSPFLVLGPKARAEEGIWPQYAGTWPHFAGPSEQSHAEAIWPQYAGTWSHFPGPLWARCLG